MHDALANAKAQRGTAMLWVDLLGVAKLNVDCANDRVRSAPNTTLIVALGAALLAFGLGLGTGANLNAIGILGATRLACATPPLSARARFLACTMAEDVHTPEELEAMLAQSQGRAATPAWGVP